MLFTLGDLYLENIVTANILFAEFMIILPFVLRLVSNDESNYEYCLLHDLHELPDKQLFAQCHASF